MSDEQNIRRLIDQWYDEWFAMDRLYSHWARARGLTLTELFTLYVISANEEFCTPGEIAEKLSRSRQTVNSALDHLEKEGLIQRRKDPLDGRGKVISFTPEGRGRAAALLQELEAMEFSVTRSVGVEKTQDMVDILKEMVKTMSAYSGEKDLPLQGG